MIEVLAVALAVSALAKIISIFFKKKFKKSQ